MPRPAGYQVPPAERERIAAAMRQRHRDQAADLAFARRVRQLGREGDLDSMYALLSEFLSDPESMTEEVASARAAASEAMVSAVQRARVQGVTLAMLRADFDKIIRIQDPD